MNAIGPALVATLAWAVSTLCSSSASRRSSGPRASAWVFVVGLVITAPWSLAVAGGHRLSGTPAVWLAVAGATTVLGFVFALAAYRDGQVSIIAPIVSTEGAMAALIAVAAGATLSRNTVAGVVAVALGVVLASRAGGGGAKRTGRRAVLLALAAAAVFGVSLYATARAGDALPAAWVVCSARLFGTVFLAVPLAARRAFVIPPRAMVLASASGALEVLGFLMFVRGAQHDLVVTSIVGAQYAPLASCASVILHRERLTRLQTAGVVLMVVGVVVLSLRA